MKTRSCDFLRFHADGEGKKEGNKEFRGGKLAKKKKIWPERRTIGIVAILRRCRF